MSRTPKKSASERQQIALAKLRAKGGRPFSCHLNAQAGAALDALAQVYPTRRAAVEAALVAWGHHYHDGSPARAALLRKPAS